MAIPTSLEPFRTTKNRSTFCRIPAFLCHVYNRHPKRLIVGLGFLPTRLRAPIMNIFMAAGQHHDVQQDVIIWRSKQYRSFPRLCRSDGEIMPFRYYCAQFYPDPSDSDNPIAGTGGQKFESASD